MPRNKTKRAKRSRRSARSGNAKSSLSVNSLLGGFEDRQRVTLRYTTSFTSTPTGVTVADYVFAGNSAFDPDVTSTGLQPANFDDFSAVYTKYRVWGSTLNWSISNNSTGVLDMLTHVVGPRRTATAVTSLSGFNNFMAQPYTKMQRSIIYNNGTPSQSGSMTMSTQKYMGMSKAEFEGADDLSANVTANPTTQWYWHLTSQQDDNSSTTGTYWVVILDYDIEFFARVDTALDLATRIISNKQAKSAHDADGKDSKLSSRLREALAIERAKDTFERSLLDNESDVMIIPGAAVLETPPPSRGTRRR